MSTTNFAKQPKARRRKGVTCRNCGRLLGQLAVYASGVCWACYQDGYRDA